MYGPPISSSDTISSAFASSPYVSLQIGNARWSESFGPDSVGLQDRDDHLPEARLQRDPCFQLVLVRRIDCPTAYFELRHADAIDADIDVARHVQPMNVAVDGSLEPDPEDILTVDGEIVACDDTAARAQRKFLAERS